jgi:lipase ATG15
MECVYDVVSDLGWHVSMVNHRIHVVIDDVIEAYNTTPACVVPPPCKDCFNWKFIVPEQDIEPSPSSVPATSTTSEQPTPTDKPEKCLRRAWWGGCIEWGDDDDDDNDGESPAPSSIAPTESPHPTTTKEPGKCLRRSWFGRCIEWGDGDDDASLVPITT